MSKTTTTFSFTVFYYCLNYFLVSLDEKKVALYRYKNCTNAIEALVHASYTVSFIKFELETC